MVQETWACDNVPPFGAVESLADRNRLFLKINISRRERKQFCFCQAKSKKNIFLKQINYFSFFTFGI